MKQTIEILGYHHLWKPCAISRRAHLLLFHGLDVQQIRLRPGPDPRWDPGISWEWDQKLMASDANLTGNLSHNYGTIHHF
jgi:hypothetical protein